VSVTIESLSRILVEAGMMSEEQRLIAVERGELQHHRLMERTPWLGEGRRRVRPVVTPAQVIASLNFELADGSGKPLTEDRIVESLAARKGWQYEKIDPLKLDLKLVTNTLSMPFARRHSVVPLSLVDGVLRVAMSDPDDMGLVEQIKQVSGLEVVAVASSQTDIQKVITETYGFSKSVNAAQAQITQGVDLGNLEQFVRLKRVEDIEADDRHIINAVEYIFHYAFDQRASDIHVEPKREVSLVRFRIDGVLHDIYRMPKAVHAAVVSRIKTLARLDIAERRLPQDGRIKTRREDREVEVRASTLPTAFGEKLVLRIFDPGLLVHDLTDLGLSDDEFKAWERFIANPYGLIVVTGPTGSGKTTTLYSSLEALVSTEVNICTIEDPIEMVMESFNQLAVLTKIGLTFPVALRHILRQDPDIIMVGEVRDAETAELAVQAALTGHLVFTSLHTNDTSTTVTRLVDLGVDPFQVASTLIGVLAQRLVRKVCSECREEAFLTPDQMALLDVHAVPDEARRLKVWQGKGCVRCRGTGLYGRTGIFELLEMSDAIRRLVLERASSTDIERAALADGMVTLRECAVRKLAQGITSFGEIIRMTAQE
jgi:general secretion pathway protein E